MKLLIALRRPVRTVFNSLSEIIITGIWLRLHHHSARSEVMWL